MSLTNAQRMEIQRKLDGMIQGEYERDLASMSPTSATWMRDPVARMAYEAGWNAALMTLRRLELEAGDDVVRG